MLLDDVIKIFNETQEFEKSKNFYFEKHQCEKTNKEIKINFDYSILSERTEHKIIFGHCPHCKKTFYNVDYD
ncbi:MAG: hypothetical protein ACK5LT_11890 [Lachnospirales bacterium]